MKNNTPDVVLDHPKNYVYRRLFILNQLALVITRYQVTDGVERQLDNDDPLAAVTGYCVYMYQRDDDPPRLICKTPDSNYLLAICAAKEVVASWLLHRVTAPGAVMLARKELVTLHEQSRALLNFDLRQHWAARGGRPVLECKVGEPCTTNGNGDYGFNYESRAFFGRKCHIVSQSKKTGMYWVSLDDNPTQTFPFPKRNLEHVSRAYR